MRSSWDERGLSHIDRQQCHSGKLQTMHLAMPSEKTIANFFLVFADCDISNWNRFPRREKDKNETRLGESGVRVGGSEKPNRATAPVLNSQTSSQMKSDLTLVRTDSTARQLSCHTRYKCIIDDHMLHITKVRVILTQRWLFPATSALIRTDTLQVTGCNYKTKQLKLVLVHHLSPKLRG